MKKRILLIFICMALACVFAGCSVIEQIAPLPEETVSTATAKPVLTPTPLPTLGDLEPLDAAYCMEPAPGSHDADYSVLRFFPSGAVLQVTVQGQNSCAKTWDYIAPYLKETATDTFSHGEYQYSGGQIRFALAPAGSDEMAGEVNGIIEEDRMILDQQGTEMIYVLVYGGKTQ